MGQISLSRIATSLALGSAIAAFGSVFLAVADTPSAWFYVVGIAVIVLIVIQGLYPGAGIPSLASAVRRRTVETTARTRTSTSAAVANAVATTLTSAAHLSSRSAEAVRTAIERQWIESLRLQHLDAEGLIRFELSFDFRWDRAEVAVGRSDEGLVATDIDRGLVGAPLTRAIENVTRRARDQDLQARVVVRYTPAAQDDIERVRAELGWTEAPPHAWAADAPRKYSPVGLGELDAWDAGVRVDLVVSR